jgi:hypothetical protein
MRYPAMFIAAPVIPASAVAPTGPHAGMGPVEAIAHQLGQHYTPELAGACIAAPLLIAGFRLRRRSVAPKRSGIVHG